jgi:hypothetical protein
VIGAGACGRPAARRRTIEISTEAAEGSKKRIMGWMGSLASLSVQLGSTSVLPATAEIGNHTQNHSHRPVVLHSSKSRPARPNEASQGESSRVAPHCHCHCHFTIAIVVLRGASGDARRGETRRDEARKRQGIFLLARVSLSIYPMYSMSRTRPHRPRRPRPVPLLVTRPSRTPRSGSDWVRLGQIADASLR